ncbi:hypothetical protein, partial [Mycolicibacter senuensis]|uniref:hypothetical protein n=1 Tax=Mycolicibacter senuensis TaxID=386913 RepID=UPI001057A412
MRVTPVVRHPAGPPTAPRSSAKSTPAAAPERSLTLMRHYYTVEAIRAAEAPLLASLPDGV